MSIKPKGIVAKVHALQGRVATLIKDKTNPHFKYQYVSAQRVNEAAKAAMADLGIVAVLNTKLEMVVGPLVLVSAELALLDADDAGQSIKFSAVGSGTDTGDKGAAKAVTMATKYATIAALFGATEDDPEADGKTDKPAPSTEARKDKPPAEKQPQGEPVAVVITSVLDRPERVGRRPFVVETAEGIFQNFDRKVVDGVIEGSIVIYRVGKFGKDIVEVKNKEAK